VKTDAIVRAALGVLEVEGIDGLTLQRVAHALGITTTALYRYFPSKDALLAALQRRAVTELHEALTAMLAGVEPRLAAQERRVAALARILTVARFHRQLPQTHADAHRLVAVLLGDPRQLIADEHAAATVPLLLALLGDVQALLDAAAAAGACEPGDANTRAIVLWATLHGLGQLSKLARLAPRTMALGDLERDAVAALLRGFGADARLVQRAARALGNDDR
jgi:AcrR family transcriptional regulator